MAEDSDESEEDGILRWTHQELDSGTVVTRLSELTPEERASVTQYGSPNNSALRATPFLLVLTFTPPSQVEPRQQ